MTAAQLPAADTAPNLQATLSSNDLDPVTFKADMKDDINSLQSRLTGVEVALDEHRSQMEHVLRLLQTLVDNQRHQPNPPSPIRRAAYPYNRRQPQIEIQDFRPDFRPDSPPDEI
ncbi:hypothetical protein CAPTEDRAFT_223532 [Capitella teleta]|uniref:Uncharacterized protein n=1 Tax=Capitella teleta TaxID=283909 RepID=R7U2C4_CAPTE|nr:hypothetical protein CAPTEDRAFT_223532 [Capitella teleta]|eukprot:ELT97300.1 hypothetical protein CAPTEDRAFT_223532 [Capitella teleta]